MADVKNSVLKKLYERPGYLVRRCQQIHVAIFLQELEEFNLTPIQYSTLFVLSQMDGIDQATIAGYVAIDKSTSGNVVMRLEARGLVNRKSSPYDGRVKLITLTAKGRKLVKMVKRNVDNVQHHLLEPLNNQEKEVFLKALKKIADSHNEMSRAPLLVSL